MDKNHNTEFVPDEMQKIIPVDIEREVKKSFMEYAVSVIISRARPDVRGGLKPVHRRILYTMYDTGLTPEKAYRKSATAVGDVLGSYHPHGDASVYDAMVRLAQDFSLRYPLVDGHGNFGSVDGDPPAAYRYTEARLKKLSMEMVRDIEKETVNFMPNYDGRLKEPTVLPARFPNLLVNGAVGIAVGMATNIPPHNLCEVINAATYLLDHPDATMEELMAFVPGPDFPTGGIIMGRTGIRSAYATGRGYIKVRGRTEIQEMDNGKFRIVITEIPYLVNKAKLCEAIADLVKEKRVEGITAIRDESSRKGMRIVVEISKNGNPNVILNQLFQYTQLQDNFAVNMLALSDNTPKILNLHGMLTAYLQHQKEVIIRRTRFDLRKALDRAHILEGLRIAVDNIDEVVRIIRASKTVNDAKEALMARFSGEDVANLLKRSGIYEESDQAATGLTEAQANAIVSMTLGQLTGLGIDKIEKEFEEKMTTVRDCRDILSSDLRVCEILKEEMGEIKKRFGDERRTEIQAVDNEIDIEDLIEEETCVFTLTNLGYIKRVSADTYRSQRRGGRGVTGMSMREEDLISTLFVASTHDYILLFTNYGRVYRMKGYQIPEAGRTAKGVNIVNLLQLESGEKVSAMLHVGEADGDKSMVMVTKKGIVKRLSMSEIRTFRRTGLRVLHLREDDGLITVLLTAGEDDIIVGTRKGQAARFSEEKVRAMGRNATGVIGIRLAEDDEVIGAVVPREGNYVLTVTERGYGKMTPETEFPRHGRGGKGVTLHNLTEKTGDVAGMLLGDGTGDMLLITNEGTMIRTAVETVRICGRSSQGVILMRTGENEHVIDVAAAPQEEEKDGGENVETPEENVNPAPSNSENETENTDK